MPQKTTGKAAALKGAKSAAKSAKTKPTKAAPVSEMKIKEVLSTKAKPMNGKAKSAPLGTAVMVAPVTKTLPKIPPKMPVKAVAPPTPLIEKAKAALKKVNKVAETTPVVSKAKSRKLLIQIKAGEAASALLAKWVSLNKKADQITAKPYNMKAIFEEKTAIMHKVLGWGYILTNRNDRLEVLFKDGIKYLISNYKP